MVGVNQDACGCFIRTTHVLSCVSNMHVVASLQGNLVPLELIHIFWKKLHIEEHNVNHEESRT